MKGYLLPITQHHSIEELRELHRDALRDLKALLLRQASFSISRFSSSCESKEIILTVVPHTREIVVTGKTPEMSCALEKVTEDLLVIKNIEHQSYDPDLYYKISDYLTDSMRNYQFLRFEDRYIKEDIAFIKTTQGHIMSSKPYTSSRGYYRYHNRHRILVLNIEQKIFKIESIEHQAKALQSDVSVKTSKGMLRTDMEREREMMEIERREMEREMEMERMEMERMMMREMGMEMGMERTMSRHRIYPRKRKDMNMKDLEVYQETLIQELHRVAEEQLNHKWLPLEIIEDVELVIQRMIVIENRINIM